MFAYFRLFRHVNMTLVFLGFVLFIVLLITLPRFVVKQAVFPTFTVIPKPVEKVSIQGPFALSDGKYQIPDLKSYLVYYGMNQRPDHTLEGETYSLGIGDLPPITVKSGETFFLLDKGYGEISWSKQKTSLWIEGKFDRSQANIQVQGQDEEGKQLSIPSQLASFSLQPSSAGFLKTPWKLGQWDVTPNLLQAQKVAWVGKDLFLHEHGGKEFQEFAQSERLDVGQGKDLYSVFVEPSRFLIWEDKWQTPSKGENTQKYPLLEVVSVKESLMELRLWDTTGKRSQAFQLPRLKGPSLSADLVRSLAFLGIQTRTQYILSMGSQKLTVKAGEWLLQTSPSTWQPLTTQKQIEDYLSRQSVGALLVIDQMIREKGQPILLAHLFDPSRTEMKTVEFPQKKAPLFSTKERIISKPSFIKEKEEIPSLPKIKTPPNPEESLNLEKIDED